MTGMSATEEILLAAAKLAGDGLQEFSEWDLTVAVWKLNKERFGCRGYEDEYPDHQRVMKDFMGDKPLMRKGWMERTRRNHYHVTPLGLAEAARLSGHGRDTHRRGVTVYDGIEKWAFHKVFEAHLADESEPRTWLGASAFLTAGGLAVRDAYRTLNDIRRAIAMARELLEQTGQAELRRGDHLGNAISRERLESLASFVNVLEERFSRQFEAIGAPTEG
jgi:hypothetical protein